MSETLLERLERCAKDAPNEKIQVYPGDVIEILLSPAPAATATADIGDKRALFPDGARTFNQQLKRITDVACVCPKCKWSGKVFDCEPDVDGDGGLGCPKCNTVVECEGDAPATVTGWRPEWGILEVGEVIEKSDEWWDDEGRSWCPIDGSEDKEMDGTWVVRRRLALPAAATGDEKE